jgi:hypothetical protein
METGRTPTFIRAALVAVAFGSILGGTPRRASAFCCPPVRTITLQAADPTLHVRGSAEIDECLGMSFLRIKVVGRIADGTQYIAVFPGREPLLGDWFTMMGGRGETVWQGITLDFVTGRTLEVTDDSFMPVLTGQF